MAGRRGGRDEQGRKLDENGQPFHNARWVRRDDPFKDQRDRATLEAMAKVAGLSQTVSRRARRINPHMLTDAQLLELIKELEKADRYDWKANARPEQLEPDDYKVWLLNGGRGMGKTRTGSETVKDWVLNQGMMRVAVIAKGSRELRNVCFEGVSGLISVIPPEMIKSYRKGLGDTYMELTNGAMIIGYSSEAPDAIRGQAFDGIWGDEFAAWPKHLAQDMYDQAWFCLRESERPRMILTTTPKRVEHLMKLLKRADEGDSRVVVTKGKTSDNTTLTKAALAELYESYGGTHLGRQELDGELLEDVDGALWLPPFIDWARWNQTYDKDEKPIPLPRFVRTMVGLDPSGSATGDATGIVVIGYTADRRIFVLACYSTKGTPEHRYGAACAAAYKHAASHIVIEYNYGGDNGAFAVENQWKHMRASNQVTGPQPRIVKSTLKGDKAVKAGPVAQLYEQQLKTGIERIFHVAPTKENNLVELESEMLSWIPTDKKSPNSMDALVIVGRRAMQDLGLERTMGSAKNRKMEGGYDPFAQ